MKLLKLLASAVGLILALVVVAIAVFAVTFDANQYKQELSDLVEQQTGRKLTFTGDIGLSLYPTLGMKLGAMQLSNAKGFGDEPMFAVELVSVSVDFLSLLKMQPEIDQLVLDGLTVRLHKNAKGTTNFDDLLAKQSAENATQKSATPPPQSGSTPAPEATEQPASIPAIAGSFAGLNIQRANLVWRDDTTGDEYRVKDLQVVTGRIAPETPFDLAIKLAASNKQALQATLSLDALITVYQRRISVESLRLSSEAGGSMIPVDQAKVSIAGNIDYLFDTQQVAVKGFALTADTAGGLMQKLSAKLAGEIGFNLPNQQLDIAVLDVAVDATDPSLPKGKIQAGISAASMVMRVANNSVFLDDLVLNVDGNRFAGFIHANDFTQPDVSFKLHSQKLDVDALLGLPPQRPEPPPEAETPEPKPKAEPAPPVDVQIALPMELLRSLKLDGQLDIDVVRVQYLDLNNLQIKLAANQGVINVKPLEIDLYDGHNSASVQIDARAKQPKYAVTNQLSKFQIGGFLQAFMGKDLISGRSDLKIDLTTGGEWLSELKAGLNGNIDVAVHDGALSGFNLRQKIEETRAKLRRQDPPAFEERKTDFSALTLSGAVKNGVFSSQDLNMQAPLIRVGGKGSVDLVKETVDYLVEAKVVTTGKGQDGGSADELSGIPVPVAIRGPWTALDFDVQYDELLKAQLDAKKAAAKQKIDAEKARVAEKLAAEKAAAAQKLADEKAKLQAAKDQKLAEEKARLEAQKQQAIAAEKARLDAQKREAEEKAKDKLKQQLQKLF